MADANVFVVVVVFLLIADCCVEKDEKTKIWLNKSVKMTVSRHG